MKLSKALLQAMAVGLAIGTVSSCEKTVDPVDLEPTTEERCDVEQSKDGHDYDCPACGLG